MYEAIAGVKGSASLGDMSFFKRSRGDELILALVALVTFLTENGST